MANKKFQNCMTIVGKSEAICTCTCQLSFNHVHMEENAETDGMANRQTDVGETKSTLWLNREN